MALTKEQIEEFTASEINSRNFLIFARLLNIKSNANYRKVMELLATRRINYFMINDLRLIDDQSISNFLAVYEATANPQILFSAASGTFRPSDYLEGTATASTPVEDLIGSYNLSMNNDYTTERKFEIVKRPATLVGKRSVNSYQTEAELRNTFQEKVLLPTLKYFGIKEVRELFPLSPDLEVSAAAYTTSIRDKYESIMGGFLPFMTNDSVMSVFLTVNDSASIVERLAVESNEIYNFQRFSRGVVDAHRYHLFELASLGRPYSAEEIAAMEASVHEYRFPTIKLSECYSRLTYSCALIRLHHSYNGAPAYLDGYIAELEKLVVKIMKFKEFLDVIQRNIFNSIKLTNVTGN